MSSSLQDSSKYYNWSKHLRIEVPRPDNPTNTRVRHKEMLNNCFDLIVSHQQGIPGSLPLEIEPVTGECRAETLPLSQPTTSHTGDAKSTRNGNCVANLNKVCMVSYSFSDFQLLKSFFQAFGDRSKNIYNRYHRHSLIFHRFSAFWQGSSIFCFLSCSLWGSLEWKNPLNGKFVFCVCFVVVVVVVGGGGCSFFFLINTRSCVLVGFWWSVFISKTKRVLSIKQILVSSYTIW